MKQKPIIVILASLATSLAAGFVQAQVRVTDAWIRATVPHQQGTGAFMRLTAPEDSRLVSVSSPVTPTVEVHEMAIDGAVMRMRQIDRLDLPAGRTVELKPGGYHVMLMNLKTQMKEGERVPLTLVFENRAGQRETVEIQAAVRALSASPAPAGHADHGAHKGR